MTKSQITPLPKIQVAMFLAATLVASTLVAEPAITNPAGDLNAAAYAAWDTHAQPIGPNHRSTLVTTAGGSRRHTVEVATGMNYWNGTGWILSHPNFTPSPNGFAALHVQHPVKLAGDLYTQGAVTQQTPDGITLSSTPIGIALYDAASGDSEMIATITNCAPGQIAGNQVLYSDAVVGGVCASILYTITESSFQQDVILTGNLDPATYGFPRATTRIEIWTEFYDAPVPDEIIRPIYVEQNQAVRNRMVTPDFVDHQLGFGSFVLNLGKAYVADGSTDGIGSEALVAKDFITAEGRTFLVESVPYSAISNALQALPPCQTGLGAGGKRSVGYAGIPRIIPNKATKPLIHQAMRASPKGLVIDYVASIGGSLTGTIIFKGDTTYLVSSAVTCNGPTIVEGGAVLKYKSNTSITLNNTLTCKTGSYRPAIFTGVDDNLVGDTMNGVTNSGYTGTISTSGYANPAISMGYGINLNLINFRFCYAQEAIKASISSPTTWAVTHSQFINCIKGIEMAAVAGSGSGSGSATGTFLVNNCLLSSVGTAFLSTGTTNATPNNLFKLCNTTMDHVSTLGSSSGGASLTISATNSIFANIANTFSASGMNNGFYNSAAAFGSPQYVVYTTPFQPVGAGGYYLTTASGFASDATTSSLSASLASDLQKRSVYPPIVMASVAINTNLALSPQATRDTYNTSIGYHYDPLDYALGSVYVTNATVTMTNGTAVATFGTNSSVYGLGLGKGSSLSSMGAPNKQNWFVLYDTVMEGTNGNWQRPTNSVTGELYGATPAPSIATRFTSWSVPAQDAPQFYAPTNSGPINFQDNEFHSGLLITLRPTIELTNCLLERTYVNLSPRDGNSPYIRNSLFLGGTLNFAPNVTNSLVKDNLFDQTAIPTNTSIYTTYNGGYNAFVTNQNRLLPTFGTDRILTNSPAYQIGPLGFYYQTNNTLIINAGDTNANLLGLYHYTTQTNLVNGLEIKETNSIVDIGYHYIATDQYGNPIDTDGDGIPDYLEDANGDGLVDNGESSWLLNNYNGLTFANGLLVFTPLK